MKNITVTPGFSDLDALGHVNNTVPSYWFELARTPFIKMFDPNLEIKKETFPLIIAHTDYDFTGQIFLGQDVTIKTCISRIGTKSFTVHHEAFQQERLCVKGDAVIVYFDFKKQQTVPIPDDKRKLLEQWLA